MSSLPIGWENRSNCMSEKDMQLGGIAATKFIDKSLSNVVATGSSSSTPGTSAYSEATSGIYQTSDQVREHYFRQIEHQNQATHIDSPFSSSNQHSNQNSTPMLWDKRQQMRQLEAEGYRNQGTKTPPTLAMAALSSSSSSKTNSTSAHVALVKIATSALEGLADVLEHDNNTAEISLEDRSAFAKAIQRAMQSLAAAKN